MAQWPEECRYLCRRGGGQAKAQGLPRSRLKQISRHKLRAGPGATRANGEVGVLVSLVEVGRTMLPFKSITELLGEKPYSVAAFSDYAGAAPAAK